MYSDRFNGGAYGDPYRIANSRPDPYGSGARRGTSNALANKNTPNPGDPSWANFGFDRVTPGPGGGLSYELDPNRRPYWANSSYLEPGMGGLRPGMSIPNYNDYYRRNQAYNANNPPPSNTPTNVIGAEDYARMGYSGSAEYLAATDPQHYNPDGTLRSATGAYGPNGPIPMNQQQAPRYNMPMPRPNQGSYYGGGQMFSGGYGGGGTQGRGGGGYGGMMGGFRGGR